MVCLERSEFEVLYFRILVLGRLLNQPHCSPNLWGILKNEGHPRIPRQESPPALSILAHNKDSKVGSVSEWRLQWEKRANIR